MTQGFKRLLAMLVIIGALCAAYFFTGCATVDSARQRHTKGVEELNILEDAYMAEYYDSDFYTQVQWRYKIDPQLRKARFTLFSWDIALSVKEDVIALEKERAFLMAKEKLILMYETKWFLSELKEVM